MHPYADILHLPRHVSPTRPQMPMADRAAQFSPFAALTGYDDAIRETGRLTQQQIQLGEDALEQLDRDFARLLWQLEEEPLVEVVYFLPDPRKDGGKYCTVQGRVKKLELPPGVLVFREGTRIPLEQIRQLRLLEE